MGERRHDLVPSRNCISYILVGSSTNKRTCIPHITANTKAEHVVEEEIEILENHMIRESSILDPMRDDRFQRSQRLISLRCEETRAVWVPKSNAG